MQANARSKEQNECMHPSMLPRMKNGFFSSFLPTHPCLDFGTQLQKMSTEWSSQERNDEIENLSHSLSIRDMTVRPTQSPEHVQMAEGQLLVSVEKHDDVWDPFQDLIVTPSSEKELQDLVSEEPIQKLLRRQLHDGRIYVEGFPVRCIEGVRDRIRWSVQLAFTDGDVESDILQRCQAERPDSDWLEGKE